MAKPLDDRIAAAMGHGARTTTVAELIAELGTLLDTTQAEHDRLDTLSKSATASETEADQAADDAAKLARKLVRLRAKQEQLEQRHADLMNSERRKKAVARYEEVRERRDTLAAELRERWPALADEMAGLIRRIRVNDVECEQVNRDRYDADWLESAEAMARELPGGFHEPGSGQVLRFTEIRLPSLTGRGFDVLSYSPLEPIGEVPA